MFCPQCGAKNADTENFCNQCGTALKQAVSPSPIPGSTLNMPATTPAQPTNVQYTMPAATSSGRVRLMIVFNVDFTQYGDDPQAGYAIVRPDGSCPACDTLRAVMGR